MRSLPICSLPIRSLPIRSLRTLQHQAVNVHSSTKHSQSCIIPNSFSIGSTTRAAYSYHNHVYFRSFSTPRNRFQSVTPHSASASQAVDIVPGKLAAPQSSLPGELEIPERLKDDSTLGYYFKVGKGYLSFYKTGLKNVYKNYVASRDLQKRIDNEGKGTITELVDQGRITRGEFQFVMRTRHDSRRIPIFALMFIICGEFTPFVVILLSSVVPFTCRIPKQILSHLTKLQQRRSASFDALPPPPTTTTNTTTNLPTSASSPNQLKPVPQALDLTHLTREQLMHVATTLDIAPSILNYIAFPYLLQRRVQRRIEYLELDDILIERFGGIEELVREGGKRELEWAAVERGIDTLNRRETELREALKKWFEKRKQMGRILPQIFFERR